MSCVAVVKPLVENELAFVPAVDGVVRQMHKHVRAILLRRCLIFCCTETSKSFFKEIYTQGVNRQDKDVETNIELKAFYQKGILDVLLSDVVVIRIKVFVVVG